MAYDENIRIIAEELERVKNRPTGDKLPEVETTDEGKVLTVNSSGEWAAADLPQMSDYDLDYSTTEIDTGKKWIDNSTIYKRVIVLESAQTINSDNWYTSDETYSGINRIINGCAINEAGAFYGSVIVAFDSQTSKIQVGNQCATQPITNMKYIIIEYTKTSTTKKKGTK